MSSYITGEAIKALREQQGLTQRQLADTLGVTDKAISKWETGRGLPDVTLVEPLARALHVSVAELLSGEQIVNANRAANLLRARFYVCPLCGNVLYASGDASISCCGVALPPLESEEPDDAHLVAVEVSDGEVFLRADHPMRKEHFISFFAYVTTDHVLMRKLYPEQEAIARFPYKGIGRVFAYCNKHGLIEQKLPAVKHKPITRLV